MSNSADIRDLSVIVVNWNTREDLRRCLTSVTLQKNVDLEVVVVDNASYDGSAGMVRDDFPSVRLIENSENLGFSKANNQGIEVSRGRYVMLLNSDAEVKPGALKTLVEFGDGDPGVGIFGPKVLNPDGSLQYSCRSFPTLMAGIFRNTILGRFFPKNVYLREYLMVEWDHSETRDVDWVSGCAMVIRRRLLEEIGTLDERFFMYCEDVDIAYRANQAHWRVAYVPTAEVVHARSRSSDQIQNKMIVEFHRSMHRFFRKHYAKKYSIFTWALVPAGLFARASFFILRNYRVGLQARLRARFKPTANQPTPRKTR